MRPSEISDAVLMGSHAEVKAFWAPVIAVLGPNARYDGAGGVLVQITNDEHGTTRAENWKLIWAAARAARAALPETFKVSKPRRSVYSYGALSGSSTRDSFRVSVRTTKEGT